VIVIMQENRSFDSYFGTFPRADGIPRAGGDFAVCLPDPRSGGCQKPYHDSAQVNGGGQHDPDVAAEDIDGGRMDGFVRMAEAPGGRGCGGSALVCSSSAPPDVVGYHDAREIPNYWRWAHDFTLQDRMFESNASWSLPAHLFLVSGWSAHCTSEADPDSCGNGYGIRVPAMVISPWVRRGAIDHQTLSFDAFNKFIEDRFLGGQRINPRTDGRPDPRPDVREAEPMLGDLAREFDFHQRPLPPDPLPIHPAPGPASLP
jgi:phospholipase C